jgi:hypothetical protein
LTGVNRAYPFTDSNSERYVLSLVMFHRYTDFLLACRSTLTPFSVSPTPPTSTPVSRLLC